MKYKGKSVEIIGRQRLFDKETLWIHVLDDDTFIQVLAEELEDDGVSKNGLAYARFVAIATKIKQEIADKHILAPYESNLIPLPHQILVLEKVMKGVQTRFMLADEVRVYLFFGTIQYAYLTVFLYSGRIKRVGTLPSHAMPTHGARKRG